MNIEKLEKVLIGKKFVDIESSVVIRQDGDYKDTFNPIYRQMMDEGLV